MIRYSFQSQINPPAPFVRVTLRNRQTGATSEDVPAQVDTAADRTVIPAAIAISLGLQHLESVEIGGLGGVAYLVPVYAVIIAIHDLPPRLIFPIAHKEEPWVLLGRDVLNYHRIVLDGPRQSLEIS
jgi:predicted aspartyl protease